MLLARYSTLSISIALALITASCGKREVSNESRAKAEQQIQAKTGMSATLLKLKSEVQRQPRSGAARYDLGARLLAEGDPKAAVIELKHALELKHPELVVLPLLVEALAQSGQYRALIDGYGNAKLADPAAQARLLSFVAQAMAEQGDVGNAAKTIDLALASNPKSSPALLMKARLAGMRNDIDAGIATLDNLLLDEPNSDAAWVLKGELLQRQPANFKRAMQAHEQALKIRPTNTAAISALVALHLSQGDLDKARARLAELKKVEPDSPNTVYVDGHVAYAAGDHTRARELFQAILKVLPNDVNVLLSSGENELLLDATLQAESLFAKALALAPANLIARQLLAQAQIKLGKSSQALLTLAPLVDVPDANADALFLAANARLMNGEAKAAEALYGRLAKLKPTAPKLRTAVATAGFGKHNDETVIKELRTISDEDHGISADLAIISAQQRKGQYDQALEAAAKLALKRPKDPMVPYIRGRLQLLKQDTVAARQSFEQALQLKPTYFPSVAALSALDIQDNQIANARARIDNLLRLQPSNAMALLALAEISAKQGAPRGTVLKELNAAAMAAPTDTGIRMAVIAYHLQGGEAELALAAAQSAVAAQPDNSELLDLLARCQIRAKQTQQALTTYSKIAILHPKSPHASLGMIDVHLANNDLDAAQRVVEKLLEIFPELPAALGRAGVIAVRKNQAAAGLSIARRLQAQPGSAQEGLLLEGQIESNQGNWDTATAALRKAVEQYNSANAALLLHTTLLRSGKAGAAKSFASQWLSTHSRDTNFLFYLGSHAELAHDLSGAEQRYREVLAIDPNNILALNNLAMLLLQRKDPGATALAERAVEHAQDKDLYLDTLAQAYAAANKLDKAIDAQKRAVALAPQDYRWRLALAKLLLQAGNKAAAKAELDRLAALGNSFAQQDEVATLRGALSSLATGR